MRKQPAKKKQRIYQIYGINGCFNIVQEKKLNIIQIDIMAGGNAEKKKWINNLAKVKKYPVNRMLKDHFLKKYAGKRTQGIVVSFQGEIIQSLPSYKKSQENECILVVDNLEDPQNLGQIIRTAECAGIDGIIFPSHNSFKLTNTIINISQGAFVNMHLYEVTNISTTILELKKNDYWIIGIENSIDSKLWSELDYSGNIAIVVGSEGKGIRKKVIDHCDFLGNIPMQGNTNSLNVSAAVSAVLFERLRQIKFK